VHLLLFAVLAATARWRFGSSGVVLVLVVAYAGVSEVIQGIALEDRSGDVLDVVADLAGAGLGWAVTRPRDRLG
jgi:VanZ family protein